MNLRSLKIPSFRLLACALLAAAFSTGAAAQNETPLTSQELVKLVYQLPQHPGQRDAVVSEIRRRGIGFELTGGLLSVVASKSGNDALLRRTLEEAARRRANPAASVRPNEAEAAATLESARGATRAALGAMPDFVVRQLITRAYAFGTTQNWHRMDNLTVGVSYRESEGGERYKLLATNGVPTGTADARERGSYEQDSGASSTGEFVSMLRELFSDAAKAEFKAVDTDTIRKRRALIYEYEVKLDNSQQMLSFRAKGSEAQVTRVGSRGRVWVDRETSRVLRLENVATEIPAGFPITAAVNTIDYDWVTIAERKFLLPVGANVELTTTLRDGRVYQNRNEIRFRNYQRFGAEVKIVEEDDFPVEPPPKKP